MTSSILKPKLIEAYRRTEYRVFLPTETVTLRIGVPSPALAAEIKRTDELGAAFLTAENPFSEPTLAAENTARQERLRDELTALGAIVLEGIGVGDDPTWPGEASYAVFGVSLDQACALGRRFEQNAIVWIGSDGTPELVLLR